ncbi:MAG: YraN family protein [Verrucomicrobiales bacterium]
MVYRWVVRHFDRLLKDPVVLVDARGEKWPSDRVGRFGELVAARWLWLTGGCRVLRRNFRGRDGGELDLVIRDGDVLGFVEVKTRTSTAFGRPALAVDREKQGLVVRGARQWMSMLGWPEIYFRFDVVEVVLNNGDPPLVTWIRGAFHLPDHLRW